MSGVPLGGIGAGKMEILPNGLWNGFTFLNNWTQPIASQNGFPGILGYHLGIFVEKKAFLLQTVPVAGLPVVKYIDYQGDFPLCTLRYEEPSLGLDISLEAFSPWELSNARESSVPCSYFQLKVKNRRRQPVRAAFLFIGRNLSGDWCVGRQNRIRDEKENIHLEFSNVLAPKEDFKRGTLLFSFRKQGWKTSYLESWNAVTKNFFFNATDIRLSAWDSFSRNGELPNLKSNTMALGENRELCGAVAAKRILQPSEEATFSFMASWHFPDHAFGHRYAHSFKNVSQVQHHAFRRQETARKKIKKFHALVRQLPFPDWFQDALINNLSPFFSSSWYVKDGRFAFYEAPVICPLMGTVDVGFYGSIPLSYFFPGLEISQIKQFAAFQREDGYIPHDLGRNRIDIPSNGTTFYLWKDLNPKFILMVYRDFLWSGDAKFLRSIYPNAKKAMRWSIASDKNQDGLPDHEGADQTFDLWDFEGANPYTAGIYLAALLASRKMALQMHDASFEAECQRFFEKGRMGFENLWNGRCFGRTCALSQLNGQWYADLLNLGDIANPAKIKSALSTILDLNARHSRYGLVNSALLNGRIDASNKHAQNIWFGMNYAFISLCLMRGFPVKKLLKSAYLLWDNVTRKQKDPWNQPDMVDSKTGQFVFGDAYYRNMAIWSIPMALAGRDKKTAQILKALKLKG